MAGIDFIRTAEKYGYRVTTREAFLSAPNIPDGLADRARAYDGSHVFWDPDDDEDGFLLVGDDPEALARNWWEGTPSPEIEPVYRAQAA